MTPQNRARLVAAIAAPLFLLHAAPGHCVPAAPVRAAVRVDPVVAQLPHTFIAAVQERAQTPA